MSLLANGVIAIALLGVQDGKADPNQRQDATLEEQTQVLLAVRQETELRDFTRALESWKSVKASAEKSGNQTLVLKAELGQARCLQALGKHDEAIAMARAVLAADPKNAEATSAVAKFLAGGQEGDELNEIVRRLADVALSLTSAQEAERIKSARSDLVRMSDVAVPQLADLLRDNRVGVVGGASYILVQMLSERSFAALSAAMKDPRCRYPKVLVDQATNVGGEVILPFLEATLTRTEPELRRWAADRLKGSVGELTPEAQIEVAKRLLADPDEQIRFDGAYGEFSTPALQFLVPTFQATVDSKDEAALKLGVAFLTKNREKLPADVVARWSEQLMRCPIASIRIWMLDADYEAAASLAQRSGDSRRRALALMRYLMDDDATVFSAGAHKLEGDGTLRASGAMTASRDSVVSILRRAIEISGVSLANRFAVLTRIALDSLSDEDLFDLFVRLADHPADAEPDWRASARDVLAYALLARYDASDRDRIAAARLPAIPDGPGRRVWFDRAISAIHTTPALKMFQVHRAAARLEDKELRAAAYRFLAANGGTSADQLPHFAEDLRTADASFQLVMAQSIRGGAAPELVAPLRALTAKSSGELHDAALGALAYVGGKEAADELMAVLKVTPKNGTFKYLRQLEQAIGADRLAAELVVVAKAHGTSDQIVWWMKYDNSMCVSSECATSFVRQLPPNLVGSNIFSYILDVLAPDVVAPLVCQQLHDGKGYALQQAARLAGRYHIEAAWSDLVALLDTGAGQTREEAIAALKSLRDYRELKRSFAADDSDARRAAFEKAKAMTASKSAEQRAGAAIALAATGDVAAIPPLLDLLGDGDESVRAAARKALEKLADRAATLPVEATSSGDGKGGEGEKGKKKAGN